MVFVGQMNFVQRAFRSFFFAIDSVVYGFISDVYDLLLQLTRVAIFDAPLIADFASRIYAIAGLFMLFKVSISFVHYVINPDDFVDKEKGFQGIVKRIIISLSLLVITPYIFSEAFKLQRILLEDNIIMNLVFGSPANAPMSNEEAVLMAGRHMQFTLMYNFLQPNFRDFADLEECRNPYISNGTGGYATRPGSQFILALNPGCFGEYNPATDLYDVNSPLAQRFVQSSTEHGLPLFQHYSQAVAQQSYALLMRSEFVDLSTGANRVGYDNNSDFIISYSHFVSTIVGIATVYLLLLFCIDIAIRSVKLGFLEMIAPVPILSYIDPKSSKDKGMFHQWYKMCITTYLSLFLRLFALFMGIYVISMIAGNGYRDVITGEPIRGSWLLEVFMIIGILIFAKQLPKIIEDIFGVKMDGKFTLNPLKRLSEEALGGKQLIGAGAAGLAGAAAFGTNAVATKGNIFKRLGSGLAGTSRALSKGAVGAAKGEKFGKNFTNSYGAANKGRQDRDDRQELGISAGEMMAHRARQAMGRTTKDKEYEAQIKRYDEAIKAGSDAKKKAESEVDKKAGMIDTGVAGMSLGALRDRVDVLKNTDSSTYAGGADQLARDVSAANSTYFKERKAAVNTYIDSSYSGSLTSVTDFNGAFSTNDTIVQQGVQQTIDATTKYNLKDAHNSSIAVNTANIGDSLEILEQGQGVYSRSDDYRKAQEVARQTVREKNK